MSECPVCYSETARCKLVCGHTLCRQCVKSWYHKCTDSEGAKCPMCRKRLYFKGMYKVLDEWEQERIDLLEQQAFEEVFEDVLEEAFETDPDLLSDDEEEEEAEETDDDATGSDSYSESDLWDDDWGEPPPGQQFMENIRYIQERFQLLRDSGLTVNSELLDDTWYELFRSYQHVFYENSVWLEKGLYQSRYKGTWSDAGPLVPHYETRPHDAFETVSVILAF
jgi:hypothetical protein